MAVLPVSFLLASLFLCGRVASQASTTDLLRDAALSQGPLTCVKWDCDCTFNRQRGCCCGANDMYQLEENAFTRMTLLWKDVSELGTRVEKLAAATKVAFKAKMDSAAAAPVPGTDQRCFGPFNTNVPIPYSITTLNEAAGYNPSLGVFTAPKAGVYSFSFTVYSYVQLGARIYHKVQLMKNGIVVASAWENNREDGEDSATQVVVLEMKSGDQVYMELTSGRKLCNRLQFNSFSGHIVYPEMDD
ncbi:cerebellin 18 [Nelusetta ayraudi]|uniref:cerebellin 18 n=1 Tax=Nelusetta ayraudi TaxID=303726 RepID=UPI003F6ECE49